MNYCPKCGDELFEDSEFCMNCGFKLPTKQEQTPATHEEPEQSELAPVENTSTESIQVITKKRNKKRILLVSLISALVIVLAVGAVWFFFLRATGSNFLNIEWNESKTNAEKTIIDSLDGKNVKYSKSGETIDTKSDPYFGLGDDGELRIITKYNSRNLLNQILVMVTGTGKDTSIYDTVIGKMNRIFGASTTKESSYDIETTWSLEKTNIEARAYDFSGNGHYLIVFIEFNPK